MLRQAINEDITASAKFSQTGSCFGILMIVMVAAFITSAYTLSSIALSLVAAFGGIGINEYGLGLELKIFIPTLALTAALFLTFDTWPSSTTIDFVRRNWLIPVNGSVEIFAILIVLNPVDRKLGILLFVALFVLFSCRAAMEIQLYMRG